MRFKQFGVAISIALYSALCMAQWQWIDLTGRRIFSDRAPGPEIPAKNILRALGDRGGKAGGTDASLSPRVAEPGKSADMGGIAAAALPATVVAPPRVDAELEARKKRLTEADTAQREADERRIAQAKIENCRTARQSKAQLDAGGRVRRLTTQGEPEVMSDADRARAAQHAADVIESDCQ